MNESSRSAFAAAVVEEEIQFTLVELCRVCRVPEESIVGWVDEGVLEPRGESPPQWRFTGPALRRARIAMHLTRDLEVNTPGVALALDLLDEIEALRAQLQRIAGGGGRRP